MAERATKGEFARYADNDLRHAHDASPVDHDEAQMRGLPREVRGVKESNVHPIAGVIAVGATIWFVAVVWLSFASDRDIDLPLAIVTLFFVIFVGLFVLTASYSWHDPRWSLPELSFREFLKSKVRIETGTLSGRDVLIQVAIIPVTLALAATVIGIAWMVLG